MRKDRCFNCNAPQSANLTECAYCGTLFEPIVVVPAGAKEVAEAEAEPAASSGRTSIATPVASPSHTGGQLWQGGREGYPWPRFPGPDWLHVVIFTLSFFFCGPFSYIFLAFTSWHTGKKIVLTLFLLPFCCGPKLFVFPYAAIRDGVFLAHADRPKDTSSDFSESAYLPLSPEQVYADMRDTSARSFSERKAWWRERYAGRWVSWRGVFQGSSLTRDEVALKFGAVNNPNLNFTLFYGSRSYPSLQSGQEVVVSGELWGFYFLPESIVLTSPRLREVEEPRATPSP
jgi:hypothetical protein